MFKLLSKEGYFILILGYSFSPCLWGLPESSTQFLIVSFHVLGNSSKLLKFSQGLFQSPFELFILSGHVIQILIQGGYSSTGFDFIFFMDGDFQFLDFFPQSLIFLFQLWDESFVVIDSLTDLTHVCLESFSQFFIFLVQTDVVLFVDLKNSF